MTRPAAATELLRTPTGQLLEVLIAGDGEPVTVFAPGLAAGIPDSRPLGSGVRGRKAFIQFRGHGRSSAPPGPWSYADLASDLEAAADAVGATRALGVSLGAGALARLLTARPDRFERVVFFLPAVLDVARSSASRDRLAALLAAMASGDPERVAAAVSAEVPESLRDTAAVRMYLRSRANDLLRYGLAEELSTLVGQVPVPDLRMLARVTVPALIIGCTGDDLHPAAVAERLAAALPQARLHVYDRPGVLWTARADLRERIAGFLAAA
jgi:pimeloyl-ACP methyl ester carboxylesterase